MDVNDATKITVIYHHFVERILTDFADMEEFFVFIRISKFRGTGTFVSV